MKIKDLERVIFTPGVCRESLTSDYYDVDNTIVVGVTGSGKTTTMQAIMDSIIDSNEPEQFSLMYVDLHTHRSNPFCNENRIIPCMSLMREIYNEEGTYKEKVQNFLKRLMEIHEYALCGSGVRFDGKRISTRLIIAIDGFEMLDKQYQELVFAIMKKSKCIKFILGMQSIGCCKRYLYLVPYRIVTRSTDEVSNEVLHCNLGHTQADLFGTCWFHDIRKPGQYKKYVVEYLPVSYINRALKVNAGYTKGNIVANAFKEKLDDPKICIELLANQYKTTPENLITAYIEKNLHEFDKYTDEESIAIFNELQDELSKEGFNSIGPVSVHNTAVVSRVLAERLEVDHQCYLKPMDLTQSLIIAIKAGILEDLKREGIIFGKVVRGKTNKNSASIIEYMKKSILKNGFPHLSKPEERSEAEPQLDYSMSALSEMCNTLTVNAAKKCVDSIPEDFDDYPEVYKKKYINYLNEKFGEELISRLMEDRAIRLSSGKEHI